VIGGVGGGVYGWSPYYHPGMPTAQFLPYMMGAGAYTTTGSGAQLMHPLATMPVPPPVAAYATTAAPPQPADASVVQVQPPAPGAAGPVAAAQQQAPTLVAAVPVQPADASVVQPVGAAVTMPVQPAPVTAVPPQHAIPPPGMLAPGMVLLPAMPAAPQPTPQPARAAATTAPHQSSVATLVAKVSGASGALQALCVKHGSNAAIRAPTNGPAVAVTVQWGPDPTNAELRGSPIAYPRFTLEVPQAALLTTVPRGEPPELATYAVVKQVHEVTHTTTGGHPLRVSVFTFPTSPAAPAAPAAPGAAHPNWVPLRRTVSLWRTMAQLELTEGEVVMLVGLQVRSFQSSATLSLGSGGALLRNLGFDQARQVAAWYAALPPDAVPTDPLPEGASLV